MPTVSAPPQGMAEPAPRARLKDVAALARVSLKTVTNVVHERPNVADETRERVRAAIAELDYRPSLAGRQLRGVRSNILTLAVPRVDEPYLGALAHADHRRGDGARLHRADRRDRRPAGARAGGRGRLSGARDRRRHLLPARPRPGSPRRGLEPHALGAPGRAAARQPGRLRGHRQRGLGPRRGPAPPRARAAPDRFRRRPATPADGGGRGAAPGVRGRAPPVRARPFDELAGARERLLPGGGRAADRAASSVGRRVWTPWSAPATCWPSVPSGPCASSAVAYRRRWPWSAGTTSSTGATPHPA